MIDSEIKWKAIKLRKEGYSFPKIAKELNLKSDTQPYTWWQRYRKGETHRFYQSVGKQYTYGFIHDDLDSNEKLKIENNRLKAENNILKKYQEIERKWYQKLYSKL